MNWDSTVLGAILGAWGFCGVSGKMCTVHTVHIIIIVAESAKITTF